MIGHFAKRAPFHNIGLYLVSEALRGLIALGLDLPKYARVDFWESLIEVVCIVAAFVGGLSVNHFGEFVLIEVSLLGKKKMKNSFLR